MMLCEAWAAWEIRDFSSRTSSCNSCCKAIKSLEKALAMSALLSWYRAVALIQAF